MIQEIDPLRMLGDALLKQAFCPVLGSGAGADLGIPIWRKLIGQLGEICGLGAAEEIFAGRELTHIYDLLALSEEDMRHRLRVVIYGDPTRPEDGLRALPRNHPEAPRVLPGRKGMPAEEPALHFLATLACFNALSCEHRRFHVLTYNVDTCLEEEISRLGHDSVALVETRGGDAVRVRWRASPVIPLVRSRQRSQYQQRVEVRVFHPHGIVLREDKAKGLRKDKNNTAADVLEKGTWRPKVFDRDPVELGVVFGRKDYNRLFGSLDDPRNRLQLAALMRFSCLFYGFSFMDPNVDRLLDVSASLHRDAAPKPEAPVPRHVALARFPSRCQLGRPTAAGWKANVDLEHRESQRLLNFGVTTCHYTAYNQHKRFVIDLIRTAASGGRFRWPGAYAPPGERLSVPSA